MVFIHQPQIILVLLNPYNAIMLLYNQVMQQLIGKQIIFTNLHPVTSIPVAVLPVCPQTASAALLPLSSLPPFSDAER